MQWLQSSHLLSVVFSSGHEVKRFLKIRRFTARDTAHFILGGVSCLQEFLSVVFDDHPGGWKLRSETATSYGLMYLSNYMALLFV